MAQLLAPVGEGSHLLASFAIGQALYAIPASEVQEIIRMRSMTPVPHSPPEVKGALNLRGRIVTILDASLLLNGAKAVTGPESRIMIVADGDEFVGLQVDCVTEVLEGGAGLEPLPANVPPALARFFRGLHREDGRAIAIVDVPELLSLATPSGDR